MDQVAKMKRMEERNAFSQYQPQDDIDSIITDAVRSSINQKPSASQPYFRVNPADISILMVYLEGKNRSISKTLQKSK